MPTCTANVVSLNDWVSRSRPSRPTMLLQISVKRTTLSMAFVAGSAPALPIKLDRVSAN